MELPAIVQPAGASGDTEAEEAELLVDAVVANQLRSQLSLVEEALACRRLKTDHGHLTDEAVDINGQAPVARTGPGRPGAGEALREYAIELADVTERERAQKRAER